MTFNKSNRVITLISGVTYVVFNFTQCQDIYKSLTSEDADINIDKQCSKLMWKCNFVPIPFMSVAKCS